MAPRREQLVFLLNRRRRRTRLLLVCLVTALAGGAVVGVAGPRILIGSVAGEPEGPARSGMATPAPAEPPALDLPAQLGLDPREIQANVMRWPSLSEAQRQAILARYWNLAALDESERSRLLDTYTGFRCLQEKRQELLRLRARRLQEFVQTLSPQDQAMLESMDMDARAQRLLQLWQARYGAW